MSLPSAAWGQQYTITTIAGNGAAGFQDAAGTSAQLNSPANVFVTSNGNVYIADDLNQRVRLLSGGNVTTVAGSGTSGYAGDGSSATAAYLTDPLGVAVDSSGNLYIADTGNQVVRKVTSGGTISTYAGNNGFGAGYSGDAGPATNAQLNSPVGLAIDTSGNLYIADTKNNLIRKVTAGNGNINTVVGNSSTTLGYLNQPTGVAVDAAGNIYIANQGNNSIYKFTAATGRVTRVAGNGSFGSTGDGGPATFASLGDPKGVAIDAAGSLYIADTVNNRVRKVTTDGIITTIAGTGRSGYTGDGGPAAGAQLSSPSGVFVDSGGNIYIADTANSVIRMLQPVLPVANSGGVANAASYQPQISPGALATIYGTGFGTATTSPAANPTLPTSSGGVSVTVNGQPAPLFYVSPGQINFQVPWETTAGTASVAVTVGSGASNAVSVPVVSAGPGLFNSCGGACVQNYPDYSLNSPSNPAPAGNTIIAYLTGTGPVSPAVGDGAITPGPPSAPLSTATLAWSATIGSATAQVSFYGLTPGFIGLAQANIVVPSGLAPGTYTLVVTIGGQASNNGNVSVK
ncbi:MAG TPA: IPT/TIG domain-containing protein [Candidatus Sulfopaludibacter sp.]|nr:IPT/TIG domain-containing protein [Candidatus Sulfopaludibacter sp.]